jgi:hypothetical protein
MSGYIVKVVSLEKPKRPINWNGGITYTNLPSFKFRFICYQRLYYFNETIVLTPVITYL